MFQAFLLSIFPLSVSIFLSLYFVSKHKVKRQKGFPLQSGLVSIRLLYLFSIFYFLFSQNSYSQDTIKKPKIGLVLSGGGAKGFAHIGVLKVLEESGIKIDYIGGTSMGAVIGGLYACGYNATELDSIFKDTKFDELLQDFVPRNNKTFYEKHNDEMYAVALPFDNFKLSVPKGISKGIYNYNLISRLTHNMRYIRDFTKLKIPFLCAATNVETGKEKIFREGELPMVLLASSAFPSLFAPVEIDGSLYIDGGIANNYPVEEVRKMGADIIIGVDVQDDLKKIDELNGATGVLVQIANYPMIEKMKGKVGQTDIYIRPNIKGYGVVSFEKGKEIIQRGVDAAMQHIEEFKKLATTNYKINDYIKIQDSIDVSRVSVNDLKNYTRSYVVGKLRFNSGEKISYSDLHSGINNLNSTQNFSSISYKLVEENDKDHLILELKENPNKMLLKFGLHYDDVFKSAALINFTKKNLLFTNDVASLDLILGDNSRFNFDYYRDNGFYTSFGFKSKFNRFKKSSKTDFSGNELKSTLNLESISIEYLDFTNQAYIQTIFAQKFLLGGGVENKYVNIATNSSQINNFTIDRSNYSSVFGFIKYDSFNNKFFPKKGWYLFGDVQYYFASSDYKRDFNNITILKGDAAITQTFFKKVSVKIQQEAGLSVGENTNNIFNFTLGGYGYQAINNFRPFFGYDFLELSGNSYLKGSVSLDYEFIKKNHLNLTANYANIGNNIFKGVNWVATPKYTGFALGYGMETLLGPIEVKQSWSPEAKQNYTWFSVGFWF
jgi:NTE family protein